MKNKNILLDLDNIFCEETQKNKAKGWVKFFAEDGVMITSGVNKNIVGKEEIFKAMNSLFNIKGFSLTWEPTGARISNDLGYTYGNYIRRYLKDGEIIEERGKYTTIWKYTTKWEIVLDIGN